MTTKLEINGQQAALYYNALATAIIVIENRMTLKSAEPFKQALALQIAAYKGEMVKLATTFPELT
jgi:hypothetical protein